MTGAYKKKLIEVALPLEAINIASAREKSIRHGHPSTLHLWWARRPLAAARAVIFAQMVDDPSGYTDVLLSDPVQKRAAQKILKQRLEARAKNAEDDTALLTLEDTIAEIERQRLFKIIEELVKWENTTNQTVLQAAKDEIWQSWRRTCAANAHHPNAKELFNRQVLPAFHDPFAGGGALPLEAQRLGLESYASDLNPVAVLINKAMIEIPPKFAGRAPINPVARQEKELYSREWTGAKGLAEDVRYYGHWMREQAEQKIGHLYPKIRITTQMVLERPDLKQYENQDLTVIAWLWARTVKSPNPAFSRVDVPLASTFMLSTKAGKEAYVQPVVENGTYQFTVKVGKPANLEEATVGTTAGKRNAFRCLMSGVPITYDFIRKQGQKDGLGVRLMAIVAEGIRGRIYLSPTDEQENLAREAKPEWQPDMVLAHNTRDFKTPLYGLTTFGDLFTSRQLVALTTFSDLVQSAIELCHSDALETGWKDDGKGLDAGGLDARAYAEAVGVYLSLAIDKSSDYWSTICSWHSSKELIRNTFGRQAIPMVWDFAETNPFSDSTGNFSSGIEWSEKAIRNFPASIIGYSEQKDAQTQTISSQKVVSTDPPYYDNIGYADLSDFFYVWLRRSIRPIFPDLYSTLAVPKEQELVATPYRHGSKDKAEKFFLDGMTQAMHNLAVQAHPAFPVTIYYAFKQSETKSEAGLSSTGWETFLEAVIQAGFALTGTIPMRTEMGNRMIGAGTNALASSIVLVCRTRTQDAPSATRSEFVRALKRELPMALRLLQAGNIAPVDLAQAAIGPGMGVYTRYSSVLDAEGRRLSVRDALSLINATLDEALAEQEGDFDPDSRWALAWFEQYGFNDGDYGVAETLSKAKNTSVEGLKDSGILNSSRGNVRLLRPNELKTNRDFTADSRVSTWELVHQLIRVLETEGELKTAELVQSLGSHAEIARELAYRLYTMCERKKRANEAQSYNALVQSWSEITRLSQQVTSALVESQSSMFEQ